MKASLFLNKRSLIAAALMVPAFMPADDIKWYDKVTVGGFVDAYYKYNPHGIKGTGSVAPAAAEVTFDKVQNSIAMGGGKVSLSGEGGKAVVDLYFGDYGNVLQTTVVKESVAVAQAYLAQPVGPVTVTLGRFFTHVGYEVADSVANLNYTRGLLYGQVPFFHQGVKLNYSPLEGLGLMAMVDNGNSVNVPTNEATTGGAQISYAIAGLSSYFNYYYEPVVTGGEWEPKHYFDIVLSYPIMDGLTFAGEYLYYTTIASSKTNAAGNAIGSTMLNPATGKQIPYSPKSQGYAVYLDYATPLAGLSLTPRFEAFYAPDQGGTDGRTKFDYTLSARYVDGSFTNWLELRANASDDAIYQAAPKEPGKSSYSEFTTTYAVGYKF